MEQPVPGVREGQRLRAERTQGAGADRGTSAVGRHGLLAGTIALRCLRTSVHSRGTGRRGPGEVRRNGVGDDRAAQVWEWHAVLSSGTTGAASGHSIAGDNAMGNRRGGCRSHQAGTRRVTPAGGARRGTAQRRYRHAGAAPGARSGRPAHRCVHQRNRCDDARPANRAVLPSSNSKNWEFKIS